MPMKMPTRARTIASIVDRARLVARPSVAAVTLALGLALTGAACGGDDDASSTDDAPAGADAATEADLASGEAVYGDNCAECHGDDLRGTDRGPSHLSMVYEPGHHPDAAFAAAIAQGSTQHHWEFGDMPPVEGLDDAEVTAVIAYVRSVQEAEGFEPYPPE